MGHIVKALNLKSLGVLMVGVGLFGVLMSAFVNGQVAGQGPGAWDVVQAALNIESHLSGFYMDVYNFNDPGMQPALTYWHSICQPTLCLNTLPATWLKQVGTNYVQCAANQPGCVYHDRTLALQCVGFVEAAYGVAGHPLPDINLNGGNFFGAYAHIAGWHAARVGTEMPLPGDLLGMSGGQFGHIAIVVSVTPPAITTPGSIVIAQANAPGNFVTPSNYAPGITTPGIHLLRIPLLPDLTVPPIWGDYHVQGYMRNPSLLKGGLKNGNASQRLVRIDQSDPKQYDSQYLLSVWGPSACSAAAMAEVLNAYGGHYHIADILKVEAAGFHPAITPSVGLVSESGIQQTMAQFGFQTVWGDDHSLDRLGQIVTDASAGLPVIVSFPPGASPLFGQAGHILVVAGGDLVASPRGVAGSIRLVDSSGANLTSLPATVFLSWWRGFYAIAIPENGVNGGLPAGMPSSPWVYVAYSDAIKYGINSTYFLRQINQESGFNPSAVSDKGAVGIAQFEPATAQAHGIDPWDPTQALDGAARLMAQNYQKYLGWTPNDPTTAFARALAEYNAGAGAVSSSANWFALLPTETRQYINNIMNLNW